MYKAQVAMAGVYHKVTFVDQTHRVRRKFLLLEEKLVFMSRVLEGLRKRIDVAWNPVFGRSPLVLACNPCEAAPEPSMLLAVDGPAPTVREPAPAPLREPVQPTDTYQQ